MFKAISTVLLASSALAQTYTQCNPLTQTCKPDPALGGAKNFDFTSEQGDWHVTFKPDRVEYTPEGVSLRVQTQGDNPTLQSDFYLMFGRVEAVIQAAPGVGIVSSFVLQSDDLDEIDLEWLGGDNTQVQTNFFVKGNTDTYDRGQFHGIGNPTGQFHTYTIEWTSEQITWTINGQVVRTLLSNDWHGYPQSPMNIRMGVWAGGDPTNNPGTIQWAGGETNYQAGPYPMLIKSVNVEDYSTGDAYEYSDRSGTWQSIKAQNGEVHGVRPAVIPPADGSKFDLVSADQGEKPTEVVTKSGAEATSTSEPTSEAEKTTSSVEASSTSSESSTVETSSIPESSSEASSSPVPTSTVAPVVPIPDVKNTTSSVESSANSTIVTSVAPTSANKTTSTVFATVTSCKDDACKTQVANSTVALTESVLKSKFSTVISVTPTTAESKESSESKPTSVAVETKTSSPTASQATSSTSAHQANAGTLTEASFGAVAVAAFALMLI